MARQLHFETGSKCDIRNLRESPRQPGSDFSLYVRKLDIIFCSDSKHRGIERGLPRTDEALEKSAQYGKTTYSIYQTSLFCQPARMIHPGSDRIPGTRQAEVPFFINTNQNISIRTLRATRIAQIKAWRAGNGPALVKSRNTELSHSCSP
jgi:hypothetical protein